VGIIFMNLVLHDDSIHMSTAAAPFGISFVSGIVAFMSTFSKKGHYFLIDNDKIEFKFGMLNPSKHTFHWNDIKAIHLPHKQKKAKLIMKNDSTFIINLSWIEKKKSSHIRKHLFYASREKNIDLVTMQYLDTK